MTVKKAFLQREADWEKGLRLPGNTYWKFERGVLPLRDFFQHLPKIFPYGGSLMIEGLEMGLSAKTLYEEHPADYVANVPCDTIHPVPASYHVAFSEEFARRLCLLVDSQGMAANFYHFHGYNNSEKIFTFHSWRNNLEGELSLAGNLDETKVRSFASALNCTPELVPFPRDLRQELKNLNRALNPPWWRKLLRLVAPKHQNPISDENDANDKQ
jgi:hypothetical protein